MIIKSKKSSLSYIIVLIITILCISNSLSQQTYVNASTQDNQSNIGEYFEEKPHKTTVELSTESQFIIISECCFGIEVVSFVVNPMFDGFTNYEDIRFFADVD
jgi:hypothetical protein